MSCLQFHILTLFTDYFDSALSSSILGRAVQAGHLRVDTHDIRDSATDRHRTADDNPYGGGAGMVMKADIIADAIEKVEDAHGRTHRVYLTPQGAPFTQEIAQRLSKRDALLLLCGHYEGVDQRARDHFIDEEISIGDFVLTGGEAAALIVIDAITRLRPGVLGNSLSTKEESFSLPLLEHPHYTRPYDFRGHFVPEILRSGDHGRIANWRRQQSILRTLERRPDLLKRAALNDKEMTLIFEENQELAKSLFPDYVQKDKKNR